MHKLLAFLLLASSAAAQYATNLTLQKNSFLVNEPVLAVVTITNRSGADVILGGTGARAWMQFTFEDAQGRVLAPVTIGSKGAISLKAGGTTQHTVEIEGASATSSVGTYYARGAVFHPPSGQYYETNRARISVTDSKPMFDEGFGVPKGFPSAGRARRYQAIIFRDIDSVTLYARLVDDRTKENLSTRLLGPIMHSIQPQMSVDAKNNFQLLFMASPGIFCHTTVKPDGKVARRSYYKDIEGSRPTMVLTRDGARIVGGEYFDPAKQTDPNKGIRKSSERPDGL
ncbi:MAG: hypothetical protein IPK32_22040 [Verrucomicrobiaceae bacterium]|nr:hypothetical protein [Verrucomicrobiaceae bacterium]